jgi:inhibitor of KinA sporulation pathway (predicted exonuclease)
VTLFTFPPEFVLFDLEYTAWQHSQERKWSDPGEHREVIQIGAIRVSAADLNETESLLEYVRPQLNPMLSDFIIELTGITQYDVDTRGVPFSEALKHLAGFIGTTPAYCWGRDTEVLEENCKLLSVPFILNRSACINLRPLLAPTFLNRGVDIANYSSGTLINAFTDSPALRAHDALNDMRNLLDAIRTALK